MRQGRLQHKVTSEIFLTGLDLAVLEFCAESHYDFACSKFFESKERGRGWYLDWQWLDWQARFEKVQPKKAVQSGEYRHPLENRKLELLVEVDSGDLDRCLKILEGSGSWVADWGEKVPEGPLHVLAQGLRANLSGVLCSIQEEQARLRKRAQESLPEDGSGTFSYKKDVYQWTF